MKKRDEEQNFTIQDPWRAFSSKERAKRAHREESQNDKFKDDHGIRNNLACCHKLPLTKSLKVSNSCNVAWQSIVCTTTPFSYLDAQLANPPIVRCFSVYTH